jgi:hypothetical protein
MPNVVNFIKVVKGEVKVIRKVELKNKKLENERW